MKKLLLTSLCALSVASAARAEILLYSGEDSFPAGWAKQEWGGAVPTIEPMVSQDDQPGSLAILAVTGAEAWSGAGIHTFSDDQPPLEIPASYLESGSLVFLVNGGVRPDGDREGGQSVQVALGWAEPGAEASAKQGSDFIKVSDHLDGEVIDEDPESWQEVRIPLSAFGFPDTADALVWKSFAVQFMGAAPTSGVYVTDIRLIEDAND